MTLIVGFEVNVSIDAVTGRLRNEPNGLRLLARLRGEKAA